MLTLVLCKEKPTWCTDYS